MPVSGRHGRREFFSREIDIPVLDSVVAVFATNVECALIRRSLSLTSVLLSSVILPSKHEIGRRSKTIETRRLGWSPTCRNGPPE